MVNFTDFDGVAVFVCMATGSGVTMGVGSKVGLAVGFNVGDAVASLTSQINLDP